MTSTNFIDICRERGFFHQCTDEEGLRGLLKNGEPVPAYIGFDCTAPSLHVGSLMQIMILRWYQKCGHKPIVLMGGGTTKVGDPSGKDESRKMLTDDDIAGNMAGIRKVFENFLEFDTDCRHDKGRDPDAVIRRHDNSKAIMVNNADWLAKLNYIDFLRDVGRHFSVNRMLTMESVKQRLERESHLSFLEFNYMILQAYDFVELHQRIGCRLQIGGSDQWGNIVMGVELERRKSSNTSEILHALTQSSNLFGLTTPLLTTSSGAKMGKTASGAVWLNADLLSPYDYWQFWRNTEDADVERFLKLFTELSIADIAQIMQGNINDAKKTLATQATALLHGQTEADRATETARALFEQGGVGNAPVITLPKADLDAGIPAFKLLQLAGLAESGGEARRLIKGNGARINDAAFSSEDQTVSLKDMTTEKYIKLSAGKKRHILVRAG